MMTTRPATDGDYGLLLAWRNDPLARQMSTGRRRITTSEHAAWLAMNQHRIIIGEREGIPFGAFRWEEWQDGQTLVSIVIGEAGRGRGLATPLIMRGTLAALESQTGKCIAEIKMENTPSMKAFLRAGYTWEGVSFLRRYARLSWGIKL